MYVFVCMYVCMRACMAVQARPDGKGIPRLAAVAITDISTVVVHLRLGSNSCTHTRECHRVHTSHDSTRTQRYMPSIAMRGAHKLSYA